MMKIHHCHVNVTNIALKINHCDEEVLMWWKIYQFDKTSSMWRKFFDVMKIYQGDESISMWWKVITVMKSIVWDETLSLW